MLDPRHFVGTKIHTRKVMLDAEGPEVELWFREVSAAEFRKFQLAERSDDMDMRAASVARLIAASLCEPDGSPAFTYERAAMLKPRPANALLAAVLDVSGIGKPADDAAGNSSPSAAASGSGTSSPSPSAEDQLPNGNQQ